VDLTGFLTAILSGIAAVMVAAIANTLLPGVRWSRWLKRDLDIYNGLPEGFEKDLWREDVEWQAERLRRYTVQHPWWAKLGGWILVMLAIFVAVTFLLALAFAILDLLGLVTYDTDWVALSWFGAVTAILCIIASDVIRGRETMQTLLTPVAFGLGRVASRCTTTPTTISSAWRSSATASTSVRSSGSSTSQRRASSWSAWTVGRSPYPSTRTTWDASTSRRGRSRSPRRRADSSRTRPSSVGDPECEGSHRQHDPDSILRRFALIHDDAALCFGECER
jgi:hypothetical protein